MRDNKKALLFKVCEFGLEGIPLLTPPPPKNVSMEMMQRSVWCIVDILEMFEQESGEIKKGYVLL